MFQLFLVKALERYREKKQVQERFEMLKKAKNEIIEKCKTGYKVEPGVLGIPMDFYPNKEDGNHMVVLGEIDQDGFVLSNIGPIKGIATTSAQKFTIRARSRIFLGIFNGVLCIKKYHTSDRFSFIREITALYNLAEAQCNVPTILDIDFENLSITLSYIDGVVLKEELAKKGAKIRDCQVGRMMDMSYFAKKISVKERIQQGNTYLHEVVDHKYLQESMDLINKIHSKGVIIYDIKFGNIMIENRCKAPFFIDFGSSYTYEKTDDWKFELLKKNDQALFAKYMKISQRNDSSMVK
jgi:tRNA A-37 threonylcarbamoyl transferase component Bud32